MRPYKPKYFLTFFTMTLLLVCLGAYMFLVLHPQLISGKLKEQLSVIVEFDQKVQNKDKLADFLSQHQCVIAESMEFTSSDQAKRIMIYELGNIFKDEQNPFVDIFSFSIVAECYTKDSVSRFIETLNSEFKIIELYHQADLGEDLERAVIQWSQILLVLALLLFIITFLLIYNLVHLHLITERKHIKTLELTGATSGFIRKPFYTRALLKGLINGILGLVVCIGLLYMILEEDLLQMQFLMSQRFILWAVLVIFVAIFTYFLSTHISLSRILRR